MQHKGWSIFFGVVLFASFLSVVVSPLMGWWLPANVSTFGPDVDYLYYIILGFTTFFFVLTEALLVYAMYRFAGRPGAKGVYVEGHHRLEMLWTVVPGAILLYIAIVQIGAWERIKYQAQMPNPDLVVQVTARQWDWTMRYADTPRPKDARSWAEIPAYDDIYLPDEMHCWKGANVRIFLKTQDVLHSLYFPQLRLKQDALPGKTIPMWFNATDFNTRFNESTGKCETDKSKEWEITCAELCGGGHYRMRGLLYVHETKDDYLNWLKHAQKAARSRQPEKKATPVAAKD